MQQQARQAISLVLSGPRTVAIVLLAELFVSSSPAQRGFHDPTPAARRTPHAAKRREETDEGLLALCVRTPVEILVGPAQVCLFESGTREI